MANTFIPKRSTVAGKVPLPSDLQIGELAVNLTDRKIYTKDANSAVVQLNDAAGVGSFNTRTGAVTLTSADVTGALGFMPANSGGQNFSGLVQVSRPQGNDIYFKTWQGGVGEWNFGMAANDGKLRFTNGAGIGVTRMYHDGLGTFVNINTDQATWLGSVYTPGVEQYSIIGSSRENLNTYERLYLHASNLYHRQAAGVIYTVSTSGGATSDATVKTNLRKIDGALEKIAALSGYHFDFTDDFKQSTPDVSVQRQQIGVIAQEVEAVFPEAVNQAGELKAVSYEKLVAPLIEAVKELKADNDNLRAELEVIKGRLAAAD